MQICCSLPAMKRKIVGKCDYIQNIIVEFQWNIHIIIATNIDTTYQLAFRR